MGDPQQEPVPTNVHCPSCGYNLTGTAIGGRCPECGAVVAPNLATAAGGPLNGYAIASLILGIVSIPGCMCYGFIGIICGTLALVMAHLASKEIASGGFSEGSRTMNLAGRICGIIGLSLSIAYGGFFIVMICIAIFSK